MRDLEGIAGLEALSAADRTLRPASGRPLTAEMQRLLTSAVTPGAWVQSSGKATYEVRSADGGARARQVACYFAEATVFALWGEGLIEQDTSIKSIRVYAVNDAGRALAQAQQEAPHG